jgi:hypothetical protein
MILHPASLLAIVVLIVNDHLLKASFPGTWWTGKLSDFAGLIFFPLFLMGIFGARSRKAGWVLVAATGFVFAAIELSTSAEDIYRYGLGALQYPFRAAFLGAFPKFMPVEAYADPTDCLALTALVIPAWIISRRAS